MWSVSSSVNAVNLVKKICSNSRDIEFFLGDYFLVHPVHRERRMVENGRKDGYKEWRE